MTLSETINQGLNNPECAFFVGNFMGQWMSIKWLVAIGVIYFMFKVIDKLAFEPFVDWLKNKLKKGGSKK